MAADAEREIETFRCGVNLSVNALEFGFFDATLSIMHHRAFVSTRPSALGLCFLLPHTGGNTGPARSRASGQIELNLASVSIVWT